MPVLCIKMSALSHYAGSACQNVSLTGTNLICPNEVGFFRCTVNGLLLGWRTDDIQAFFLAKDRIGQERRFTSVLGNTTVYLVERNVLDEDLPQGTRTSILIHETDPNFMGTFILVCDGGEGNICNRTVTVIGGKSHNYI